MQRIVAFLIVVTAFASVAPAYAEDNRAVAREAFREGTRQYDLGEYEKALELFKKAYLNYEEPAILFNLAQCQRQAGNKTEAVKLYKSLQLGVRTTSAASHPRETENGAKAI